MVYVICAAAAMRYRSTMVGRKVLPGVTLGLGPNGRKVILEVPCTPRMLTQDGVTVAKSIDFKNSFETMGAPPIVAGLTNDPVSGGTNTTTVLSGGDIFAMSFKIAATGTKANVAAPAGLLQRTRPLLAPNTDSGDRTRCNGGSSERPCTCGYTQDRLLTATEKRHPPGTTMPSDPNARALNYPDDRGLVHYDAVHRWVCTGCKHPIGEHPVGQAAAPAPTVLVDQLATLLTSGHVAQAADFFQNNIINSKFIEITDPSEFCSPYKVKRTYDEDAWKQLLNDASDSLDRSESNSNTPLVLGLTLGTGLGKTHVLVNAGNWLNCDSTVYITYNLGQDTARDEESADFAVLLRIVLRLCGVSNIACPTVFRKFPTLLQTLDVTTLSRLIEELILSANATSLFIGIDEIALMCTKNESRAKYATFALGQLVIYLEGKGIRTTVLISALTETTEMTISNRPIKRVSVPARSSAAHDFLRDQVLQSDKKTKENEVLLLSLCGYHFRSIVVACDLLNKTHFEDWNLHQLHQEIVLGLRVKLVNVWKTAIRKYTKDVVKLGTDDALSANPIAVQFTDANGAIPPVIVYHSFNAQDNFPDIKHPLQQLLRIVAFVDPTKQLELCGYHFDRFRALYSLPVVPHGLKVQNGGGHGAWFPQLIFDIDVADDKNKCGDNLFEQERECECEKCQTKVINPQLKGLCPKCTGKLKRINTRVERSPTKPEAGKYYFPDHPSHPWIDRAVIATHRTSGEECLVLYQDKINSDSFSEAVTKLNQAADMFSKEGVSKILCIAQVVGASPDTKKQMDFKHPYLLIRDHEIALFYTPTLTPAITFVRSRHST